METLSLLQIFDQISMVNYIEANQKRGGEVVFCYFYMNAFVHKITFEKVFPVTADKSLLFL